MSEDFKQENPLQLSNGNGPGLSALLFPVLPVPNFTLAAVSCHLLCKPEQLTLVEQASHREP